MLLQCITENDFLTHNCFSCTPVIFKLRTPTPHESRMYPIDLGIKGQGHNALVTEIEFSGIIALPLHLSS